MHPSRASFPALVAVAVLCTFVACKKAEDRAAPADKGAAAPAAATCATVIDHVSALTLASPEMKAAPEAEQQMARKMITSMRGEMLAQCEAGKPSQQELACLLAAEDLPASQKCGPLMAEKKAADAPAAAAAPAAADPGVAVTTVEGYASGLEGDKLIAVLGAPATQSEVQEQGADGMFVTDWAWPDQGLVIGMSASLKAGPFSSAWVRVAAPSTAKTEAGLGIGSAVAEVKQAYGKKISKDESTPERLVVGSVYGGVFFEIADDKVTSIFVGAGAE